MCSRDPIELLSAEEEIVLARLVQIGCRATDVAQEMKLRAGGVAPSQAAWASSVGVNVQELQSCIQQAEKARSRMILANLRLVVSIAHRYKHPPCDLEDLIQEGTIGLIKAVERYDPSRGYRFSTYATWWIRDSIRSAFVTKGRTIRLPSSVISQLQRLRQIQESLSQQFGRAPHLEELVLASGLKALDIRELLFRSQEPLSLDLQISANSQLSLFEGSTLRELESGLMTYEVHQVLDELPVREAELLRLRYGISTEEPLSLSATARQMGVTRDTARGLERRVNERIRLLAKRLIHYLEA